MCLLTYLAPGADVSVSGLENACDNNPDGFGWATVKDGRLSMMKSMDSDEAISTFVAERLTNPDSHAMFHARWATHGEKSTFNVHPFYLGQGYTSVLGHNGILPDTPPKGDRRSDTRMFAEGMSAKDVRKLDMPWFRKRLGREIRGSKLVVLTIKPSAKSPFYIINEEDGHWDEDGRWWSNSSYEDPWWKNYRSTRFDDVPLGTLYRVGGSTKFQPKTLPSKGKVFVFGKGWVDAEEVNSTSDQIIADSKCPQCNEDLTDEAVKVYGACTWCWVCLDCGEMPDECLCFVPESVKRSAFTSQRKAEDAEFDAWIESERRLAEVEGAVLDCVCDPSSEGKAQRALDLVLKAGIDKALDLDVIESCLDDIRSVTNSIEWAAMFADSAARAGATSSDNLPLGPPDGIWRPQPRAIEAAPSSFVTPNGTRSGYDPTKGSVFSEAPYEGWE